MCIAIQDRARPLQSKLLLGFDVPKKDVHYDCYQLDKKAEITTSIRREKLSEKFTRLIKNANTSQTVGWLKAKTKTGRAPDGLTQQPPYYLTPKQSKTNNLDLPMIPHIKSLDSQTLRSLLYLVFIQTQPSHTLVLPSGGQTQYTL